MPNWCKGSLKIRGPYEQVKKFFEEGLAVHNGYFGEHGEWVDRLICKETWFCKSEGYEDGIYYNIRLWEPHIEGTYRAFILEGDYFVPKDGVTVVGFQQAWDVRSEDWVALSKKYGLDFRLYGFKKGNQFCREVEVINGECTIDKNIKYDDWDWECPMPDMGG